MGESFPDGGLDDAPPKKVGDSLAWATFEWFFKRCEKDTGPVTRYNSADDINTSMM